MKKATINKVEKTFDGKTSVRWVLESTAGRFTAPDWLTKEEFIAGLAAEKFIIGKDDTGREFATGDGRKVFVYTGNKILESAVIDIKSIKIATEPVVSDLIDLDDILTVVE